MIRPGVIGRALAMVLLAATWPASATETRTVEVVAEVFGLGRTPEEARREALQRARDKAVAEVTGIHIAAQQLRLKSEEPGRVVDAFSYLVHTSTHGRIIREEVAYETRLADDTPVYRATLLAEVALEEGVRDPGFSVDLETRPSSHTFRDGEPIAIEVTSTRGCYLTLLNIRSDGTVGLLFPNRFDGDNRIAPDEVVRVPSRSHGFEIRVALDDPRDGGPEQILAIATLDAVPFRLPEAGSGELALGEDGDSTLEALNRWLLQIPVERRAEALWDYRVAE